MNRFFLALFLSFCLSGAGYAQASNALVKPLLDQELQSPAVVNYELRHFMLKGVPPLDLPSTPQQWNRDAAGIRAHELADLYHGWPKQWIDSPPKFETVSVMQQDGYRIVKMRYQIVPGFYSTALLYEPEHMAGKMPAILNVNGHGTGGKAVEHKQKRCINYARRGILALNLEWMDYGELAQPGNRHNNARLLDLAGYNGAGLFYLAMRRGLDYLYNDPNVDRARIGVTGASGGGWQTIMLSSLDTRVGPAVPVAGFSSLMTSIGHPNYAGNDAEQNPADFRVSADYAQLMATRAPKPTLLIYNSMDNCCFRAGVVKQGVYTDIQPFYKLYDKPENLQWYLNLNPGTHNYGLENREASYKFFDSVFHIDATSTELPNTDLDVQSYEDLVVGVPKDNLTILSLAQSLAKPIHHEVPAQPTAEWVKSQRTLLEQVARYAPVKVTHAWVINSTHEKGVESHSYRFEFSNGLGADGVLFQSVNAPKNAPTAIVIADGGMSGSPVDVANRVDRGQRVLAFEPLFFSKNISGNHEFNIRSFEQLLIGIGQRPLGLEAAQVNAIVQWLGEDLDHGLTTPKNYAQRPTSATPPVTILTTGPRSETVAIVAAGIDPALFSRLEARKAIQSFQYVFDHALTFDEAPELMCLDLYKDFDYNTLSAIASPVKVDLSATEPEPIYWY